MVGPLGAGAAPVALLPPRPALSPSDDVAGGGGGRRKGVVAGGGADLAGGGDQVDQEEAEDYRDEVHVKI